MTAEAAPKGIVAVVRASSADDAVTIGAALSEAGIRYVEITFTVPDAASAIKQLSSRPGLNVGAGTVMTAKQAASAVEAGATFLVSPSLEPEVVAYGTKQGIPTISGAMTPTEISRAVAAGASAVKLFPVGSVGAVKFVKAVAEVFPGVPWVVSGGITPQEVQAYLQAGCTAVCLGSALIDREALAHGDYAALVAHARQVLETAGQA